MLSQNDPVSRLKNEIQFLYATLHDGLKNAEKHESSKPFHVALHNAINSLRSLEEYLINSPHKLNEIAVTFDKTKIKIHDELIFEFEKNLSKFSSEISFDFQDAAFDPINTPKSNKRKVKNNIMIKSCREFGMEVKDVNKSYISNLELTFLKMEELKFDLNNELARKKNAIPAEKITSSKFYTGMTEKIETIKTNFNSDAENLDKEWENHRDTKLNEINIETNDEISRLHQIMKEQETELQMQLQAIKTAKDKEHDDIMNMKVDIGDDKESTDKFSASEIEDKLYSGTLMTQRNSNEFTLEGVHNVRLYDFLYHKFKQEIISASTKPESYAEIISAIKILENPISLERGGKGKSGRRMALYSEIDAQLSSVETEYAIGMLQIGLIELKIIKLENMMNGISLSGDETKKLLNDDVVYLKSIIDKIHASTEPMKEEIAALKFQKFDIEYEQEKRKIDKTNRFSLFNESSNKKDQRMESSSEEEKSGKKIK